VTTKVCLLLLWALTVGLVAYKLQVYNVYNKDKESFITLMYLLVGIHLVLIGCIAGGDKQ